MKHKIIHRTWCKNCQNFTIQKWQENNDLVCENCSTVYTSYKPSEIPEDKLLAQRRRYIEQKRKKFHNLYGTYLNPLTSIFDTSREIGYQNIEECDAGQKAIDDKKIQLKAEVKKETEMIILNYQENYSKLNRNDKCSCGSNKKYKQCHLLIFRQMGILI